AGRFGELPDSRLIARKIAVNRRRLCAAPSYLEAFGQPETPDDLSRHNCIVLRQNDSAFGIWRLSRGKQSESIKVHGSLSTNDGEVALNWALDGHRSEEHTSELQSRENLVCRLLLE